jgi:hypothetical protein
MADSKKPERPGANGGTKDLKQDEVIARLVPDPADPPDVIAMVGFLGKSPKPKFWRLYQTLDLKDYVEIAEDDIVQSQSLKNERQPLGGTVIWVRSGARLQNSRSESRMAEADFMQGDITRKFLGETGMEGLGRSGVNIVLTTNTLTGQGACCTGIQKWCVMPLHTHHNICYYPD